MSTIYESLAICEWAAEQAPSLWPVGIHSHAPTRAPSSSEMHAGFAAVRRDMSMQHVRRRLPIATPAWPADTRRPTSNNLFALCGTRMLTNAVQRAVPVRWSARLPTRCSRRSATRLRTYKVTAPDFARAEILRHDFCRCGLPGMGTRWRKLKLGPLNNRKRCTVRCA